MRIRAAHGKEWNFDKLAQKGSMTIPKIPEELSYAYTYLKKTGARIPLYNMPLKRYGEKQLEGCRKAGIEHPAGNERVKEFYQPIPHWFLTPDMPWGENAKKDFDRSSIKVRNLKYKPHLVSKEWYMIRIGRSKLNHFTEDYLLKFVFCSNLALSQRSYNLAVT